MAEHDDAGARAVRNTWLSILAFVLTFTVLAFANQGLDLERWSIGSRVILAVVMTVMVFTMGNEGEAERKLIRRARIAEAVAFDPNLQYVRKSTFTGSLGPPLAGAVLGFAAGSLVDLDPKLRTVSGGLGWLLLSAAGSGLGGWFSPQMREVRAFGKRVDSALEAKEAAVEQAQLVRLKTALLWWKTHGSALFPVPEEGAFDPRRLEEYVRVNGHDLLHRKQDILQATEANPWATPIGATTAAVWAVKTCQEVLRDFVPNEKDRTEARLAYILRLHARHEALLLLEAEGMLFKKAVRETEPLEHETIEECFGRLVTEYKSILEFLGQAREMAAHATQHLPEPERTKRFGDLMRVAESLAAKKVRANAGL